MNEITTTNGNGALMSFIERAAKDEAFDVQKFEVLLRLQMEVSDKQARRAFNAAMAVAQSEMMPVIRTAQNRHLGNKYAKLEDIDREMRPIYTRHGFSVRFGSAAAPREGDMRITCTVAHADGYSEENHLDAPSSVLGSQGGRMAVTPVQAVGSTVTYLRRYLLTMVFNLVLEDDDDDGEATRRAAAAPMPRGARVAERAPAYEGAPAKPSPERTDAQWRVWLDKLRAACEVLYHRSEVVEVAERASVADALGNGPEWVRREISAILAENYKRFPAEDEPTEEEELGEVEIAGADKLAAG
jgi:ERF superfamily protein